MLPLILHAVSYSARLCLDQLIVLSVANSGVAVMTNLPNTNTYNGQICLHSFHFFFLIANYQLL